MINVNNVKRLLNVMKEMQFSYQPIPLDMRGMIVDALEGLLEERKGLEAQVPHWIHVDERLPERGVCKAVLVYAEEFTRVADWSCDRYGDDWWFYVDGEYEPLITHWMELPEPPQEVAE